MDQWTMINIDDWTWQITMFKYLQTLQKTCRCRPPKKAFSEDTKRICRPCKKYCRQYKKVLAGDTKSICRWYREPTRRDDNPRSGVCVHNRLPRGRSVFCLWNVPLFVFSCILWSVPLFVFHVYFFCNPGKNEYILVYRLPPQFLVVRQSLLFAV